MHLGSRFIQVVAQFFQGFSLEDLHSVLLVAVLMSCLHTVSNLSVQIPQVQDL